MKFQITQKNLRNCLQNVTPFVDKSNQLELIRNIYLKTNKNLLEVTATNLDTFIIEKIPGSTEAEGEIIVPAMLFKDYIQNLPTESSNNKPSTIDLDLKDSKLTISCQNTQAVINGIANTDFPSLPLDKKGKKPMLEIKASELKQAIAQVVFAVEKDNRRPLLNGVLLHSFEKEFYCVATDGYRLAEKKLAKQPNGSDVQVLIPAQALINLERILGNYLDSQITIYKEEDKKCILFVFNDGEIEIVSSLIEGVYPDYRKLLPESFKTQIILSRQELIEATKRTRLFSQEMAPSIILSWTKDGKELNIKSSASQIGENEEKLKAQIKTNDEKADQTITLNVKYLQEALQAMNTDQVEMNLNNKLESCILREYNKKFLDNYRQAIMPLKS